jgi:hypothetical protein
MGLRHHATSRMTISPKAHPARVGLAIFGIPLQPGASVL